MSDRIYLDAHASAPLGSAARSAMIDALSWLGPNASSLHREGRRARDAVEGARAQLASALRCAPRELVFTSGGTEALRLAVLGLGLRRPVTELVCDPGAHPALAAACADLAAQQGVTHRFIPASRGAVDYAGADPLPGSLVAIAWVQHETGRLARGAEALIARARSVGATVVIDAVQAMGKLPLQARELGCDALVVSGHKIGGPQGVGALWVAASHGLAPQLRGGGQERGLRAGTENVLGIVGFGAAAWALPARLDAMGAIAARRDRIERALLSIEGVSASVRDGLRVATVSHVAVEGCDGSELVASFDLEGVALSSRAACSSGRSEPSESLLRLFPEEPSRASTSLRVSLGPELDDERVARFEALCPKVIERVRLAHSKMKR